MKKFFITVLFAGLFVTANSVWAQDKVQTKEATETKAACCADKKDGTKAACCADKKEGTKAACCADKKDGTKAACCTDKKDGTKAACCADKKVTAKSCSKTAACTKKSAPAETAPSEKK